MARNKKSNLTRGFSGRIGEVVFIQRNGESFVGKTREKARSVNAAQQAVRDRFRRATMYAKGAMADATRAAIYKAKALDRRSAYATAVTDHLKPVVFGEIDISEYDGKVNSVIHITASSIGKVMSMKLRISDANGNLLEEGNALERGNSGTWDYQATATVAQVQGIVIDVVATDMPGHHSSLTKTL